MGLSIKPYENNKNWREKKNNRRNLKAAATKADTKLEEADDLNTVLSEFTFTVASDPDQVQSYSASATSATPEDPTIQGIFYAEGSCMKVPSTTTTSDTDTVTLVIPKFQVAMLAQMGLLLLIKAETHI